MKQIRRTCSEALLALLLAAWPFDAAARSELAPGDTIRFTVRTYDGLDLPARLLRASNPNGTLLLFLSGSTPYDERGNQWAAWSEDGAVVAVRQKFYARFMEVMSAKGYDVVTMAKRSFVYSHAVPRPSLDELALDIQSLVRRLLEDGLAQIENLYLVGYSEGTTVATKTLGLLKAQPAGCVLLGSGSSDFDFRTRPWQDWYMVDIFRQTKGASDEEIEQEYREFGALMTGLLDIDERTFETDWKKRGPYGFGVAPWESYHIDREVQFYNATPNLLSADIPVLIVIGTDDTAMPLALARRNYERLLEAGFEKATFRVIEDEGHQYARHDVFALIHSWITSGGTAADADLNDLDRRLIEKQAAEDEIVQAIAAMPWQGAGSAAQEWYEKATRSAVEDGMTWFKLGMMLYDDGRLESALGAFERTATTDFVLRYAGYAWIGHIMDLRHEREAALEAYGRALDTYPGFATRHDHYGIVLDRAWIEARRTEPFRGVVEGM